MERLFEIIEEQLHLTGMEITEDLSFKDDLGADSIDLVELVMALEDEYGVELQYEELEKKVKTVGDLAGPCMFAMFMGISRMLYGKFSERLDLVKVMTGCGVLCAACYILASLSPVPVFGLAGCALCGVAVGIMWPGSISISSQKCPLGGTAMFALLALAGDLGAMVSPAMVGSISEVAGGDLKSGLIFGTAFPVIMVVTLIILSRKSAKRK